ncbi:uncharacterized protein LALA0_S03e01926g [Lachancea lanzarotensis]|uniref:LALA0S03e01926g1_1 n=1 Tax=Lachancea lanzarotensis TaxID=1245769 RepID=A0A0C7N456_9SACH|nr:uncharacterized protein LALA0_S03e01926g [Lachancea lanzarotensis]CEP61396.1 LALA0S03e01926g1_1 [Lachancea lanzarotensis]
MCSLLSKITRHHHRSGVRFSLTSFKKRLMPGSTLQQDSDPRSSESHAQSKAEALPKQLLSELLSLQDEIISLHTQLKTDNAQIRKDVSEFCSIGNDDVHAATEPSVEGP